MHKVVAFEKHLNVGNAKGHYDFTLIHQQYFDLGILLVPKIFNDLTSLQINEKVTKFSADSEIENEKNLIIQVFQKLLIVQN